MMNPGDYHQPNVSMMIMIMTAKANWLIGEDLPVIVMPNSQSASLTMEKAQSSH